MNYESRIHTLPLSVFLADEALVIGASGAEGYRIISPLAGIAREQCRSRALIVRICVCIGTGLFCNPQTVSLCTLPEHWYHRLLTEVAVELNSRRRASSGSVVTPAAAVGGVGYSLRMEHFPIVQRVCLKIKVHNVPWLGSI